jgi:hypothetical protein
MIKHNGSVSVLQVMYSSTVHYKGIESAVILPTFDITGHVVHVTGWFLPHVWSPVLQDLAHPRHHEKLKENFQESGEICMVSHQHLGR